MASIERGTSLLYFPIFAHWVNNVQPHWSCSWDTRPGMGVTEALFANFFVVGNFDSIRWFPCGKSTYIECFIGTCCIHHIWSCFLNAPFTKSYLLDYGRYKHRSWFGVNYTPMPHVEVLSSMSNYIPLLYIDVISNSCPSPDAGIAI